MAQTIVLACQRGLAQAGDGGGGQAVQAAPVVVPLGLGHLRQKVAQQLAAGLLAAGNVGVASAPLAITFDFAGRFNAVLNSICTREEEPPTVEPGKTLTISQPSS